MRSSPIAAAGALVALLGLAALASRHDAARPSRPAEPVVAAQPRETRHSDPDPADALVDVNQADAATLERLPRIGPALAARIIAEREAAGPFTSIDDLTRVSGIGARTVEALTPFVTVAEGP